MEITCTVYKGRKIVMRPLPFPVAANDSLMRLFMGGNDRRRIILEDGDGLRYVYERTDA